MLVAHVLLRHDMYKERDETGENPHGGFPSGGSMLPSFALITVRGEEDRLIIPLLGDEPRKTTAEHTSA